MIRLLTLNSFTFLFTLTLLCTPAFAGSWGTTTAVNDIFDSTLGGDKSNNAGVALNDSGFGVAVWEQDDGFNSQILYSFFDDSEWTEGKLLHSSIGDDGNAPAVAINDSGDIIVVWSQDGEELYGKTYTDGEWGDSTRIDEGNENDISELEVMLDENGNGLVVWTQSDGSILRVNARFYISDTWEDIEVLDSGTAKVEKLSAAMDSTGAVVTWRSNHGSGKHVFANVYNGSSWDGEAQVSNSSIGTTQTTSAAMAGGVPYVAFCQNDSSTIRAYYNTYTSSSWGSTFTALDAGTDDASECHISGNSNEDIVITWFQNDGSDDHVYVHSVISGTTYSASSLTPSGASTLGTNSSAINASGNGVAIWRERDTSENLNRIYANRLNSGSWESSATALDSGTHTSSKPAVAINSSGEILAVWTRNTDNKQHVFASHYSSSWSAETQLDGENNFVEEFAHDLNDSDEAAAIWTQTDGTDIRLYGAVYSDGTWSAAARIDNLDTDDPSELFVKADANGDAIAVWLQSDGSMRRVYSSLYSDGSWSTPTIVDTGAIKKATSLEFEMKDSTSGYALWKQTDSSGNSRTYVSIYSDGSWSTPTAISDSAYNAQDHTLAINDSNNGLIGWTIESSTSKQQCYTLKIESGTLASSSTRLDNVDYDCDELTLAINASGQIIATWSQENADAYADVVTSFYDGTSWSDPTWLDQSFLYTISTLQSHLNDDGQAIVSWVSIDESSVSKCHASNFLNSEWSSATQFDELGIRGDLCFSEIDNDGNATLIWYETDSLDNYSLYAAAHSDGTWSSTTTLLSDLDNYDYEEYLPTLVVHESESFYAYQGYSTSNFSNSKLAIFSHSDGAWGDEESLSPTGSYLSKEASLLKNASGKLMVAWQGYDANMHERVYVNFYTPATTTSKATEKSTGETGKEDDPTNVTGDDPEQTDEDDPTTTSETGNTSSASGSGGCMLTQAPNSNTLSTWMLAFIALAWLGVRIKGSAA